MSTLEYLKLVCGGTLMCFFHLALAGSSVAYLVFAIIFLIKDYGVCGDASPLWVLVLVSVIVPVFLNIMRLQNQSANNNPHNQEEEIDSVTPVAIFLLLVSEITVGGVLIYGDDRTCESMKDTGLWVVALVLFWSLLSAMFLIIATFVFTCMVGILSTMDIATPVVVTQRAVGVNPNSISVTIMSTEESV